MPRVRDLADYLWVVAIAALALIVWSLDAMFSLPYVIGVMTLYPMYNYHEKRAADKGRPKEEE